MDLRKEGHYGEENDKIYLVVVVVDAGTRRFGRKSSPEVRRKPSFSKLRHPTCESTSGGSKKGSYFWNLRVEGYAGIYIGLGFENFGKTRYFIII